LNHLHLLVRDRGQGEIKNSMQLVASHTAQEYNPRKGRRCVLGRPLSCDRCRFRNVSSTLHGIYRFK
jgi:hypothetical protein